MFREKQKEEAIKRMEKMDLHENVIKEFEKEGKLNLSVDLGFLFWLDEEQKELVKNFEERTENLVYHVTYTNTDFGELYTMFYISKHNEEWELDREDLSYNTAVAYVENTSNKMFSEYGRIGFKSVNGGVVRVS